MVKPKVIKSGKWTPISIDSAAFHSTDFEGLAGVEELTDYSVADSKPKKSKVKVKKRKASVDKKDKAGKTNETVKKNKRPKKKQAKVVKKNGITGDFTRDETVPITKLAKDDNDDDEDSLQSRMSAWNGSGVPSILLRALADRCFFTPTKIQALTLPPAIFGRRDILGAAETGSGKTLAFGLPILNGILEDKKSGEQKMFKGVQNDSDGETVSDKETGENDQSSEDDEPLDDNDAENYCDEEESSLDENDHSDDETTRCVKVIDNVTIDFPVAGKIKSKSKYIQKPLYALILTPTRELAVQISQHLRNAAKYTDINVAVVVGGLSSQKQERLLNHGPEIVVGTPGRLWELIQEGHPHLIQVDAIKYLAIDETDRMLEKGHFEELLQILEKINEQEDHRQNRQNFVFSATLTLTHEPPRYVMKKKSKKKGMQQTVRLTPAQKLGSIMKIVGLTDPKIVDITEASGVAHLLSEAQIICSLAEKDYYLYYFLQRHLGRTLVFCNSIEAVRRLTQLFTLLGCSPWPLHAKMHQKQRLKNLERFCANPRGVLLATDVAARGLDIPNVQHVIHYQTPRTAEGYVHRSGRTARAMQEGLTVLLIEPSEVNNFTRLFKTLGRDCSLPTFPVESEWMPSVKQRVDLARRLDKLELQARRITTEHGWFDKVVKEMDLEISDDELPTSYSRGGGEKMKKQAAAYRKQLSALLSKPLIPKGFSSKYPTQTGKLVVPLFPGSIAPDKESYQVTAVQALKQSVEEQKAFKRKQNSERSKRSKRRKKLQKKANASEDASQSSDSESEAGEMSS